MKTTLCAVALAALCLAGTVNAGSINVLAFEDGALGTSVLPGALSLWGQCGTCTTTTDSSTFDSLLSGGGWNVVIYAEQDFEDFSSSASLLNAYVAGGGKLIGQTWLTGGLDNLLQASGTSTNGTVITTDGNPVFAGLGSTIALNNPGWGIFSQGWTPTAGAVGIGLIDSGGYAIVLGNGGNTYLNAGLTDTYLAPADGQRLIANELTQLSAGGLVPEPGTFVLLGCGLLALGTLRRRKG